MPDNLTMEPQSEEAEIETYDGINTQIQRKKRCYCLKDIYTKTFLILILLAYTYKCT